MVPIIHVNLLYMKRLYCEVDDYAKHVGNVIRPCAKRKAIELCVPDFNRRANMLMSYFNHTSSYVLSSLFNQVINIHTETAQYIKQVSVYNKQ